MRVRYQLIFLFLLLSILLATQPLSARALWQSEPPTTHTVQRGETLSEIADAYSVPLADLMALNGISDSNDIRVGQELQLPASATRGQVTIATHTVQRGETLSQIAEKYDVDVNTLMFVNGISNPNQVYVGQELRLPATAKVTPTATRPPSTNNTATPTPSASSRPTLHVVQRGETFSQVAEKYDLTTAELLAANRIANPNAVYVGQELIIPPLAGQEPTAAPTATIINTATATPLPTLSPTATVEPATPTATPGERRHVVQRGETFSQIAEQYDLKIAELLAANNIIDPNSIFVGQELHIPTPQPANVKSTNTETPTPTEPAATPSEASSGVTPAIESPPSQIPAAQRFASLNRHYKVQTGDTLSRIALQLGVDLDTLERLNDFKRHDVFVGIGTDLLLPATGKELKATHEIAPEQQYVVQRGDSLGLIAEKYALKLTELMQANALADPNTIVVGQTLIIPGPVTTAEKQNDSQLGARRRGFYYYTVQRGDTLGKLAEQFDSTTLAILDFNNLVSAGGIQPGQELRIPYGPPPLPYRQPPTPGSGTRFIVSLSRQHCWVLQGDRIAYSWECSTGYGEFTTVRGNYKVQSKIVNAKSRAYQLDMPYWLGIYNVGFYENGIHGLPVKWRDGKKIWEGLIGQPATYGCAMLADDNAATLFKLAYLGMPVHVIQ